MSNMRRLAAALIAVALLAACGSTSSQPPVERLSLELTSSTTNFGLALLDRLLAEQNAGNVFISPLSATIMLSMAASAAEGETKAAILKVLGVDPTADADEQARQTIQRLAQSDSNAQLEMAQAVWAQNGLKLNPDYLQRLKTDYQTPVSNLDFQTPEAPKIVNQWVDAKTHHRITSLFDSFDPSTVGLIVNATYFHALWATEFKPMSAPIQFHNFGGTITTPASMHRDDGVTVLSTDSYAAALLPYKGGRFSAVLIMPTQALSPSDFAGFLTPELWSQTLQGFHAATGDTFAGKCKPASGVTCGRSLEMPKFKLEYRKDLTDTLAAMGMPVDASLPDFCAGCFLSTILQKTYLEVDEKGTTAAAVTGGIVGTALPIPLVVDRPFAFALLDNATDAPMFLGVIGNLP